LTTRRTDPTPPNTPIHRIVSRGREAIQLDILERAVEPWLELTMAELNRVTIALQAGDDRRAAHLLQQICRAQRHLIASLQLLEALDPDAQPLNHAHECEEWIVLRQLVGICRQTLWPAFEQFLQERSITLWALYENDSRYPGELRIAESLANFDRLFQQWRTRWRTLQRSLGGRFLPGTHLYETSESWPPFFPALWNARAQ